VTRSARRNQEVDEQYITNLYGDVTSLYRLNQIVSSSSKAELGPLPGTAVFLLACLGMAWLLIGIYVAAEGIKKKKTSTQEK